MGNSTGGPARELQIDRILDVLADSVRRETIRYFETQTEAAVMPLDELVAHLEDEVPHDPARVRLELHHLHLPKLDAFGWADYDARS